MRPLKLKLTNGNVRQEEDNYQNHKQDSRVEGIGERRYEIFKDFFRVFKILNHLPARLFRQSL